MARLNIIKGPDGVVIDVSIDIGPIPQGFGINVKLMISLAGLDRAVAQQLIVTAHNLCSYLNTTRGNIEVTLV